MFGFESRSRTNSRRSAIREGRQGYESRTGGAELPKHDLIPSLAITAGFWLAITLLFMLRQDVVGYRPGDYVPHDIFARVDFQFRDNALHDQDLKIARENAPRAYRRLPGDIWTKVQDILLALPDTVHGHAASELDAPYRDILDNGAITELEQDRLPPAKQQYESDVSQFINYAKANLLSDGKPLVIIKQSDEDEETRLAARAMDMPRQAWLLPPPEDPQNPQAYAAEQPQKIDVADIYGTNLPDSFQTRLEEAARSFGVGLGSKMAHIAFAELQANPNYQYDDPATTEQKNLADSAVTWDGAITSYSRSSRIIAAGTTLTEQEWQIVKQENKAYNKSLAENEPVQVWQYRAGLGLMAAIITGILAGYVARYQRRCVRNHARAIALGGLLLAMLLLTQLAGIGNNSLYIFAITPTLVAAMILTIAYDPRFALGVATIHTLLVTVALNQGMEFFLILWSGVLTACYLLDDTRSRWKLIEVGGIAGLVMFIAAGAIGFVEMEPLSIIFPSCAYVFAAGFGAGFVVLGILPFIEKAFRITTGMTLLELADASQPLLRRLALEAPGTYNHSLSVAALAEAAADAIKANSLLCRVASYYHDVGKINKPDYFVENQMGGENRHINLSPTLSLRIIQAHVKDGVELAKEYGLPTSLLPIIEQHHGTTLVQYFYSKAVRQGEEQPDPTLPSDVEFRYPGPKPKSKEAAIVMLCDTVESACRTLSEPTASRLEAKVHELARMRLDDGQFEQSELTLRDLKHIEDAITKTLLGIYHGRITYPSAEPAATQTPNVKMA